MIKMVLLFTVFVFCTISCAENNETESSENNETVVLIENRQERFVNRFNAFHNEYYKNNNISSVSIIDEINRIEYTYNDNGDLFQISVYNINEDGSEEFNVYSSRTFELEYKDNLLTQINYDSQQLLTHSVIEYENDLKVKISDYRNDELFYFTDFEYNSDKLLIFSKYTRLTSAGVRFGTSSITIESAITYNEKGNIKAISSNNEEILYLYKDGSNLPIKVNGKDLSYTISQ